MLTSENFLADSLPECRRCLALIKGKKALTNTLCLKRSSRFIVLYGCQTWPAPKRHTWRPDWFEMDCLLVHLVCHKTYISVRRICYPPSFELLKSGSSNWWLELVDRLPADRLPVNGPFGEFRDQVLKDVPEAHGRRLCTSTCLLCMSNWFVTVQACPQYTSLLVVRKRQHSRSSLHYSLNETDNVP